MRRRPPDPPRETASIFNLSFLDVFACCLGALILILMIAINQVTLAFDPTTVQEEVEKLEAQKKATVHALPEMMAVQKEAREWDQQKQQVESQIETLQQQIAQLSATILEFGNVTTQTVNQARQVVAQAQVTIERERQNAGTLWFGTGQTGKTPRFLDVHNGHIVDRINGNKRTLSSENLANFLVYELSEKDHPVFIIRPDATTFWLLLEEGLDIANITYGFEPYTKVWDPILGSNKP